MKSLKLKTFVINTLTDQRVNQVNFKYGPILVYPSGFRRDVANLVRDGHITLGASNGANGSYAADARPGQRHEMKVNEQYLARDPRTGDLRVKSNLSVMEKASLCRTIIHESTHALQDYQRNQTGAFMAEGAAYLAGWMAALLWGYPRLRTHGTTRPAHAHTYARGLAGRLLSGQVVYLVPDVDVRELNARVPTGSASRYVFNGI